MRVRKLRLSSHVLHIPKVVLWEDMTKFANIFLVVPFTPGHYREFHGPDRFGQNIALACRIVQILKDVDGDVPRSVCV